MSLKRLQKDLLKLLKYKLNRSTLSCLYKSLRPLMEYADVIWSKST